MFDGFNEMDVLADRGFVPGMSKEEWEKLAQSETTAIRISNVANMVLFATKVYASAKSGSLAIIASTLDSLLDLLSGFILWFTAFSMQTPNPYQYPIGKKWMQPLVHVAIPLQFPMQQPSLMFQSSQHFNSQGLPIKSPVMAQYPWNPRWETSDMADRIFEFLVEECLNFKKYCNEFIIQNR